MPNGVGMPIAPGAGPGVGAGEIPGVTGGAGALGGLLARPGVKGAAGGMFMFWLLNKLMQSGHERGMRGIQREALAGQAEMVTPESLYYQAAQPTAQREEAFAHQALMQQLMGGVTGPSLAKGEFQIGG